MPCITSRSIAVSSALVASSRTSITGSLASAVAISKRCRCPPEKFPPPFTRRVLKPRGRDMISSRIPASIQAMVIVKSSMEWSHIFKFSAIVSLNNTTFWSITATELTNSSWLMSLASRPSKSTCPLQGSYSLETSFAMVLLPQPDEPTIATLLPGFSVIEK